MIPSPPRILIALLEGVRAPLSVVTDLTTLGSTAIVIVLLVTAVSIPVPPVNVKVSETRLTVSTPVSPAIFSEVEI